MPAKLAWGLPPPQAAHAAAKQPAQSQAQRTTGQLAPAQRAAAGAAAQLGSAPARLPPGARQGCIRPRPRHPSPTPPSPSPRRTCPAPAPAPTHLHVELISLVVARGGAGQRARHSLRTLRRGQARGVQDDARDVVHNGLRGGVGGRQGHRGWGRQGRLESPPFLHEPIGPASHRPVGLCQHSACLALRSAACEALHGRPAGQAAVVCAARSACRSYRPTCKHRPLPTPSPRPQLPTTHGPPTPPHPPPPHRAAPSTAPAPQASAPRRTTRAGRGARGTAPQSLPPPRCP